MPDTYQRGVDGYAPAEPVKENGGSKKGLVEIARLRVFRMSGLPEAQSREFQSFFPTDAILRTCVRRLSVYRGPRLRVNVSVRGSQGKTLS